MSIVSYLSRCWSKANLVGEKGAARFGSASVHACEHTGSLKASDNPRRRGEALVGILVPHSECVVRGVYLQRWRRLIARLSLASLVAVDDVTRQTGQAAPAREADVNNESRDQGADDEGAHDEFSTRQAEVGSNRQ